MFNSANQPMHMDNPTNIRVSQTSTAKQAGMVLSTRSKAA